MQLPENPLDSVLIASPCSVAWDTMQGDERVRFCPSCQHNVYNFKVMTLDEVTRTIESTEGRMCARLFRRPDGTFLTSDCPYPDDQLLKLNVDELTGIIAPNRLFEDLEPGEKSEKPEKSTNK